MYRGREKIRDEGLPCSEWNEMKCEKAANKFYSSSFESKMKEERSGKLVLRLPIFDVFREFSW